MSSPRIGLREAILLSVAASYALLMFNLGDLAVVLGWVAVAGWLYAVLRGPRPSGTYTAIFGTSLFLMTFWWPDDGWAPIAIPLMWTGVAIALLGLGQRVMAKWAARS